MTHGGLFEGIGGFPLAAQEAGIETIWSNELDPWCCKVLRKNFKHEIIEKDIRSLTSITRFKSVRERENKTNDIEGNNRYELQPVDIITGGFPCQPFSHAGKRKGTDDDRYLWPEMLRVIREVGPPWVIGENVAGIKSMENGRTLDRILTDLEDIGFDTETFLIPACSVGAWHRRDRIWIVAHNDKRRRSNRRTPEGCNGTQIKDRRFCSNVPDTNKERQCNQEQVRELGGERLSKHGERDGRGQEWQVEPNVGRVANGISGRVDRLKGLGNAIVPQVAYEIFKAILNETT